MATKKEFLIVVRDKDGKMIAVVNRVDGKQVYEIYTTVIADVDEVEELLNNKNKDEVL